MKRLLALGLIVLGCMLITLGGALVSGGFLWRESELPDAFAWKPPLEQVDARTLTPGTVLLPLTALNTSDALNATLDQAHLENAFALVAFDPFLDDSTRLGALLQLGTRYTAAKNTQAAQAFQIAAQLATLSPVLADGTRLDSYVQASAGLRALGARDAARWTIDQAYLLAAYTPTLQREQRARRLEQIANAYAALDADTLARQARERAAEAALATTVPITRPRASFAPTLGALPPAPAVEAARARRVAAAQRLQDDVLERAPKSAREWDADLVGALTDALFEEDQARQTYYEQQLARASDDALQLALRRDQIAWLALKYRVARGAFGAPIAAEWQVERAAIVDALNAAWEDFFRLADAQVARLPSLERAPARQDVLLYKLFVVRWGLYTDLPEQIVIEQVGEVTQDLIDAAYPALRLGSLKRNQRTVFLWLPDELYGRGEKALPK